MAGAFPPRTWDRTVHGIAHRVKPFKARYDGSDRWLERINVVSDPRTSREARVFASARVLD
jgi:hypothetical protein